MTVDREASHAMAASIGASLALSADATNERVPPALQAGREFVRGVMLEIEGNAGWLPGVDILHGIGPAGVEEAARIVAAGVIDSYRTTGKMWMYQLRLVRHLVQEGTAGPAAMLAAASCYREDSVPPNGLYTDRVLIALGAPEAPGAEAAAEVLLMLDQACSLAALDVGHLAEHVGAESAAAAAISLAAVVFLDMSDEAGDARSFVLADNSREPRCSIDQAMRQRWREQMSALGLLMLNSATPEADADLVRAYARHLVTGTGDLPDIRPEQVDALFDAHVTATERYSDSLAPDSELLALDSDWLVPTWLVVHLTELRTIRRARIPGAVVGARFVDPHVLLLGNKFRVLPWAGHEAGLTALEIGASFVVAALQGLAARAAPDVREAALFAARRVARQALAARARR